MVTILRPFTAAAADVEGQAGRRCQLCLLFAEQPLCLPWLMVMGQAPWESLSSLAMVSGVRHYKLYSRVNLMCREGYELCVWGGRGELRVSI